MGAREETAKGIEDRLDHLFENETPIPEYQLHGLYVGVIGLGVDNFEASMRIMKKFTFLNVHPIDWDTQLWSTF